MKLASLLFLLLSVGFYLMVHGLDLDVRTQFYMCLPWIMILGIPHGAVDHILYRQVSSLPVSVFYLLYVLLMGLYIVLWAFAPIPSILLFLVLSAFHFGQSQWGKYASVPNTIRILLGFSWGGFILSFLFFRNQDDLTHIAALATDVQFLQQIFTTSNLYFSTLCFGMATLLLYVLVYAKKWVSAKSWWMETGVLALLVVVFSLLPLLPAFTAYFTMLHSLRMLEDEFKLLHQNGIAESLTDFIRELLPLTIVSVVGGTILWLLIEYQVLQISMPFLFIVLIAIITFPHSIVMHSLYKKEMDAFME
jgi:Brp/Blh family beta-carotene 15,15'-monooxygenase